MSFTAGEVAAVLNQPLKATEAVYDELGNQRRFLDARKADAKECRRVSFPL
jgi:hypothetical protein